MDQDQQVLKIRVSYLAYYVALALSAIALLIPAIYNHYPLVNPDSATYLASGFKPETPFDRPITYGLLIRLFSLNGISLWLVIFMQAWIVSWLIFKIIKSFCSENAFILKSLFTVCFLAVCSSLSWLVSQVQPDVYTAIAVLCMILIMLNKESGIDRVLQYLLFFLSVAVHMSHPLLFIVLSTVAILLARLFTEKKNISKLRKRAGTLIFLSALSIVFMGSAFSKSKHVFFMGSLLEKGILKTYLDDQCAADHYKLCAYKDELPAKSDDFIWDENSPLYKTGSWKGNKDEFNHIIHNILTTPKYLKLYLSATARQAAMQAVTFDIGDGNGSLPPGTNVNNRVREYFPREAGRFDSDRQNTESLDHKLALPNLIFSIVVVVGLLMVIIMLFSKSFKTQDIRLVVILIFSGILLNCLDCAAFSIVNGRFGCKMIWLIPFCAVICCLQYLVYRSGINRLSRKFKD